MPVTRATRRQAQEEQQEDEHLQQEYEDDDSDGNDKSTTKKQAKRKGTAAASTTTTTTTRKRKNQNGSSSSSFPLLRLVLLLLLGGGLLLGVYIWWYIVPHRTKIDYRKKVLTPDRLLHHCEKHIGPPRVEEVTDGIYVALGFDLANTILIKTSEGHVVIDVSMNPDRARNVRNELEKVAGKDVIHTIIYTHSHVDHVGGAEGWVDNNQTKIWGTAGLTDHFFKQYGVFRAAESSRAARQFGSHVTLSELPCSGIGGKADVETAVLKMGFVIPTHTFSGRTSFTVGGLTFELVEAHGETHDHLFVWIPERRVLLPGDNYYNAFPNIYSIRGTSPRPVRAWIKSLDQMRRLEPLFLIPSHTEPLKGQELIAKQLRDYRDGIQYVYAATVRGANDGKSIEELVETVALPPHLREQSALDEMYGQIDWSVRAIYGNELGWFDGQPQELYKMPLVEESKRFISLLGGEQHVLEMAEDAVKMNEETEYRWALHLLHLLNGAHGFGDAAAASKRGAHHVNPKQVKDLEVRALRGLGGATANTNGRGYLLESALELEGKAVLPKPVLGPAFVDSIPIALIFEVMLTRVIPELSIDKHICAIYRVDGVKYYVTVRYGIVEIYKGEVPLFGTPEPAAEIDMSEDVFRRLALKEITPAAAVASGKAVISGDIAAFIGMSLMFEQGA